MRNVDCLRYLLYTTRPDLSMWKDPKSLENLQYMQLLGYELVEIVIVTIELNRMMARVRQDKFIMLIKVQLRGVRANKRLLSYRHVKRTTWQGWKPWNMPYITSYQSDEYDLIEVQRIPESERRIDILTKALRRLKYKEMTYLVGVQDVTQVNIKFKEEIHLINN